MLDTKKGNIMKHYFYSTLIGVSVLPALFVMPAMSDTITARQVITSDTTYTDLVASNIASTTANNGGVFYMQNVPDVTLLFNGTTEFSNNSLNNGGMGGVIGNGWLSSVDGSGYTVGGKVVFNGATTFSGNSTNNPNGGGAIFNYGMGNATSPDITFVDSVAFTNNTATQSSPSVYVGGGAINHRNGMIVFNSDATFNDNNSASGGGAIMSAGDMIFNGAANFDGNSAELNGGAISVLGGHVTFAGPATFTSNTAAGASAIFIKESAKGLTFNDTAFFSSNTGVGTILNDGPSAKIIFDKGVIFDANTNKSNGALVNKGIVSSQGGDFIFTNNSGSNGGGLKNSGTVDVNAPGVILFDTNSTDSTAGALDNGGTVLLTASDISFKNNTSNAGYGGAIFNAGDITISGPSNSFVGNTARDSAAIKSGGGAIHNRGNTGTATLIIGSDGGTNIFESNSSNAYGGAIVSRAFDGAGQDSEIIINGTTTFSGNQSTLDGGAVWAMVSPDGDTTGSSTITFNGDTVFSGNTSGGRGGAIYNNDTINFNGATTFTGNSAAGIANDIHNDGTMTFAGDTTLDGGVTGSGTLQIASGTTFDIGTSNITQGAITLDGILMATLRGGDVPQITVENVDGFTGNGVLRLSFDSAGTYKVFGNQTFANIDATNPVYDLTWSGGDVTATTKSVADIASQNNLSSDAARVISGVSDSSSSRLNDISVMFQDSLASGTPESRSVAEHAANAINPNGKSVVQSSSVSVQNVLASMLSNRMSDPTFMYGRNGGDATMTVGDVWAHGVYNKTKSDNEFNGYTRGIAAGLDGVIGDAVTLGVGYMYTTSDISGRIHDTDIESSTAFIYGQYRPGAWYANAIVSYTMSDYSEDATAFDIGVSADYDVNSFGAYMATGYDFIGGITPEVSLRYIHTNSTDYTNSLGIRNHFDGADYLTASLGTRYTFDMYMFNGWVLHPTLRYAVKYDLLSDHHDVTVTMPGVNAYVLNGDRLSRIANEVGIGLGMNYGALDISVNYDLESRADYTSQTGSIKFKYDF